MCKKAINMFIKYICEKFVGSRETTFLHGDDFSNVQQRIFITILMREKSINGISVRIRKLKK